MKIFFLAIFNWLNVQWEWLKSVLSDENNKPSIRRVGSVMLIVEFLRTYDRVSWYNKKMEDIPEMWLVLLLAALGYSVIEGLGSKFAPKTPSTTPEKPTQMAQVDEISK